MSHSVAVVLIPPGTADIQGAVEELLEPYNEGREVEPYEEDCYCVGSVAQAEVSKQADEQCGTFDQLRASFQELPPERKDNEAWRAHVQARVELEERLLAEHPAKELPDPGCGYYVRGLASGGEIVGERYEDGSACGGTGRVISTCNPKSKWDWWRIGGRWNGWIIGNPRDDDDGGFNFGSEFSSVDNNSCLASDYLRRFGDKGMGAPFALITPDGGWHEKGDMGWSGIASDEQRSFKDSWATQVKALLAQHEDCLAVACDLHI